MRGFRNISSSISTNKECLKIKTLNCLKTGESSIIVGTTGCGDMRKRLAELGLHTNRKVTMIKNDRGHLIIDSGGCKLGICRGLAIKIIIE